MSLASVHTPSAGAARGGCHGILPLTGRLAAWQMELCGEPERVSEWIERYGSPLNILDPGPLGSNARELEAVAGGFGIDFRIFFARKANKALAFVDAARDHGLGVDLASERELTQALARGLRGGDLVMTAAVKPLPLLKLCASSGTTVVIDNEDELELMASLGDRSGTAAAIALRLAPSLGPERAPTRFGLSIDRALAAVRRNPTGTGHTMVSGVHFHLDGYDAGERVSALSEALALIDALRERGHDPRFIDIGGGIPMSYLDSSGEWDSFWREHRRALLGARPALTFEGHGLGLLAHEGQIVGRANVYPYHQAMTQGRWLGQILGSPVEARAGTGSVADALRVRGLQLRCEPGRALLDGCGLTAARVEFRKQRSDGRWLIGVAMNRTQCRSTSDDFLIDPLLIRPGPRRTTGSSSNTGPIEGYLVGAYCIERELLTWREMRFPDGVEVGDIIVFPNTAGYLMHILESSSHQIPLANNLVLAFGQAPRLDAIHDWLGAALPGEPAVGGA